MDPVQRPLALTLGDPAGIGPDITLLAYEARLTEAVPFFVLLGDPDVLAERTSMLSLSVKIEPVGDPAEAARCFPRVLPVLPVAVPERVVAGRPDSNAAPAVLRSVELAVELTREGATAAVVTNPISKAVLYRAGFRFPGHTEFLAHLAGLEASDAVMMLAARDLKVVPVTIHVPLKEVMRRSTKALIVATLRSRHATLDAISASSVRVSPSRVSIRMLANTAGMGREEIDIIAPAIEAARAKGLTSPGPYPADTCSTPARARPTTSPSHVSRPGAGAVQDAGLRGGRQCHARAALSAHLA